MSVRVWKKGSARGAGPQQRTDTVNERAHAGALVKCTACGGWRRDGPGAHAPRLDPRDPRRLVDCAGRQVCTECRQVLAPGEPHVCGFYAQEVGFGS